MTNLYDIKIYTDIIHERYDVARRRYWSSRLIVSGSWSAWLLLAWWNVLNVSTCRVKIDNAFLGYLFTLVFIINEESVK